MCDGNWLFDIAVEPKRKKKNNKQRRRKGAHQIQWLHVGHQQMHRRPHGGKRRLIFVALCYTPKG